MPFLPRKIETKTKKMVQAIFVFLIVILIFSSASKINPFANILHGIQAGFVGLGNGITSTYNYVFKSRAELQSQLTDYQNLVGSLASDAVYVRELEEQITELQALIEYQKTSDYSSTSAKVISRSVGDQKIILIDKGEDQGLTEGLAVIIGEGQLIGTIIAVNKNSSEVLLIQDSESKIPGAILGSDKTIGLIEGQGGFLLAMNYIPKNDKIFISDVVTTSGLDGFIPSGLIIGLVNSVIQDETAPFQQALIEPIFDSSRYNYVLVLNPFKYD